MQRPRGVLIAGVVFACALALFVVRLVTPLVASRDVGALEDEPFGILRGAGLTLESVWTTEGCLCPDRPTLLRVYTVAPGTDLEALKEQKEAAARDGGWRRMPSPSEIYQRGDIEVRFSFRPEVGRIDVQLQELS